MSSLFPWSPNIYLQLRSLLSPRWKNVALFLVYLFLRFKGILNLICSKLNCQFFPPKWVSFPISSVSLWNQNPQINCWNLHYILSNQSIVKYHPFYLQGVYQNLPLRSNLTTNNQHYFLPSHCTIAVSSLISFNSLSTQQPEWSLQAIHWIILILYLKVFKDTHCTKKIFHTFFCYFIILFKISS